MKNKPIIGIALFILFSTFISQNKFTIDRFKIKEIKVENKINNAIPNIDLFLIY